MKNLLRCIISVLFVHISVMHCSTYFWTSFCCRKWRQEFLEKFTCLLVICWPMSLLMMALY